MILSSPGSVLFDFGQIKIYYYGIIMALSIITGLFACNIVCRKFWSQKEWEVILDLAFGTILFGFLGARIYYVLAGYKFFMVNPQEIFAVWHGGMAIHGAIIGGLIFNLIYLKLKKFSILKYLDILTFGLISGQIIGRWGNFFNSEAFGLPTFSFFKLYIPPENRPVEFAAFDYFHPTFLYESLLNIVILLILILIMKKSSENKTNGYVFFSYLFLYSLVRFFIEDVRLDSVLNFGNIPLAQVASIVGLTIGLLGFLVLYFKKNVAKNENIL